MYSEGLKGIHRTIQKDHFSPLRPTVSGTVVYEPVSAYQTSGTDLLIIPKGTWIQQVYYSIAGIQDIASFYLGFLPDLLGFELFVGALGLLLLLLKVIGGPGVVVVIWARAVPISICVRVCRLN